MTGKIPFDSLCVACVLDELEPWVGGRVQAIFMPKARTVVLELYGGPEVKVRRLLLSAEPGSARICLTRQKPSSLQPLPALAQALRARVEGGRLTKALQVNGDRMVELSFESASGISRLRAELMGRHCQLILTDAGDRIIGIDRLPAAGSTCRELALNRPYHLPPGLAEGKDLKPGPFLNGLLQNDNALVLKIEQSRWSPTVYPTGVYPLCIEGASGLSTSSFSDAFDEWMMVQGFELELNRRKSELSQQVERVIKSRSAALEDIAAAEREAAAAPGWQSAASQLLALGSLDRSGQRWAMIYDDNGEESMIALDVRLSLRENADALFGRAKKAKRRFAATASQRPRLAEELEAAQLLHERIVVADSLATLDPISDELKRRRWDRARSEPTHGAKAAPRFDGKKVKEFIGPHGETIWRGENAEANDYLVTRLGKSNDIWLHVRGGTSSHALIATQGHPERIAKETLDFAAKLVVAASASRHSSVTAVDYTLKKHVRRRKGSAPGSVIYTHEKTLHVHM